MAVRITGTAKVIRNLGKAVGGIKRRSKAALWEAGLVVRRRAAQLTPTDTGNLKGSQYMRGIKIQKGPGVEIGYTASYALWVHEIKASHKSPTQWQFLRKALNDKRKIILRILAKSAKV